MFPESAIASPIFAAVWSLTLLGAVRTSPPPLRFPFEPIWVDYIERHLDTIHEFRDTLEQGAGFTPAIAEILLDDWRKRGAAETLGSADDLDLRIKLALGELGLPGPANDSDRRDLVERATKMQLAVLLEHLLITERAADLQGVRFDSGAIERLVWLAHSLAGKPSPLVVPDARRLVPAVSTDWIRIRSNTLGERLPDGAWLVERIRELAREHEGKE
jgi:hypothetical protein